MKTILITGIGKGIGRAVAEKFLSEGYRVVGTYYSVSPTFTHEHLATLPLDLTSSQSIKEAVSELQAMGVLFDILINNAGVLFDEDDTVLVPEKLYKTLEVNLIGTTAFTENVLSRLSPTAHIVNVSSTAGSIALTEQLQGHHPGFYPAYKISKAALNMYTATLAMRLRPEGKIVSSVHPGWVRTDMGGEDADMSPEEAALHIYELAISHPETGGFWFKRKRLPW